VTLHIASILGSFGYTSPTYFPSPEDVTYGNEAMRKIEAAHKGAVRGYVTVNPNFTDHAVREIAAGARAGFAGIKLAASRRASDRLHDPIAELAAEHGVPILQHIWQHRRGEVANQEISDALDLLALAARHPAAQFILAHIGGRGRLGALAACARRRIERVGGSLGQRRGSRHARVVSRVRRRGAPALGLRSHHGYRRREIAGAGGDRRGAADMEAIRWKNAERVFGKSVMGNE